MNAELAKQAYDPKRDRLVLTYTGLFKTYDELGKHVLPDSDGPRGLGFGHLNSAPAEVLVRDVTGLVIEHRAPNAARQKGQDQSK
jgi:hypothetical protein